MKAAPPILDIQNLSIRRGNTQILRNVSWCVKPGEHWVMLGANGSGKTSLLSALTGYLMPSDGNISLLGQRYGDCDWRELRKQIGLVSSSVRQMMPDREPAIETVISGRHAMIDLWVRVTREDRVRAKQLLRSVECGYLANRSWSVLSQGERQRVLIARALMADPRLLILDEPCAGLDPAAREHFLQFIQRLGLSAKSPTLVLVTHHVEEIMPVFSHVLVLKQGRVLASGRKTRTLTATLLSDAFRARVKLTARGRRYGMTVAANRSVVV
ncbi:MAG: ABC transporter ATP-binding protein [Verrucomicrobia bacterium]|nr:ABC transporter ATP-binding protein [Verrucomicrobiota bacterium]